MIVLIILLNIIFIVGAYALGSINSAILVCKYMGLPDPRSEGSKNPGTTNVLRLGGKKAAIITLAGDVLKGFIPVALGHLLGLYGFGLALVALAAFMGHLYPYFFGFKGGKGVATALGAILALSPSVGICALAAWGITAYLFRYSSLAALAATALIPLFIWLLADRGYMIPITVLCVFIFIRHYENIRRLIAGTETKLGQKKVE